VVVALALSALAFVSVMLLRSAAIGEGQVWKSSREHVEASGKPQAPPGLSAASLSDALDHPFARAGVLNILVGALSEHIDDLAGREILERLPSLIAATEAPAEKADTGNQGSSMVETEENPEVALRDTVAQLRDMWLLWPEALQKRLRQQLALAGRLPVATSGVTGEIMALQLEVDAAATSQSAVVMNPWHQALLDLGAWTGLDRFHNNAARFKGKPADVIVKSGRAELGDCFAFRSNATITLRVSPSALVQRLELEQPARWEVPKPGTAPRRFSVHGLLEEGEVASNSMQFVPLGTFEYALAAPAAQTFELLKAERLRALRLEFDGNGWGEPYTCVYRIRAFGP